MSAGPEDNSVWTVPDGVPPIVGRRDPATGKPLMAYDTRNEVGEPVDGEIADHYRTEDGVEVTVTF